jgi:6-phosphogluconolactonase
MSRSATARRHRRFTPRLRLTSLALGAGAAATAGLLAATTPALASPGAPLFGPGAAGTVFSETNAVAGNAVLAYRPTPGGGLTQIGSVPTDGTGTGTSPASQGGVSLGDDDQLLAVVNGGSNSVSVFSVGAFGRLQRIDTTNSGGVDPISVTIKGSWVYTLNAGDATTPANIAGFDLNGGPFFRHPVGSQALNAAASSPEEIGFTPSGRDLVVTEKASGTIDVFPVNGFGLAGPAVTTTVPAGNGPYGFAFTPNGEAVVTDAGIGALTTYSVAPQGTLTPISQVADGQLAPCWVALSNNGRDAYAANAHSGTISFYTVAPNGTLTLQNPAIAADPGIADTDIAVGGHDSTLYISDQPNFDASAISPSGSLGPSTPVVTGLPAGTFGLAATNAPGFVAGF